MEELDLHVPILNENTEVISSGNIEVKLEELDKEKNKKGGTTNNANRKRSNSTITDDSAPNNSNNKKTKMATKKSNGNRKKTNGNKRGKRGSRNGIKEEEDDEGEDVSEEGEEQRTANSKRNQNNKNRNNNSNSTTNNSNHSTDSELTPIVPSSDLDTFTVPPIFVSSPPSGLVNHLQQFHQNGGIQYYNVGEGNSSYYDELLLGGESIRNLSRSNSFNSLIASMSSSPSHSASGYGFPTIAGGNMNSNNPTSPRDNYGYASLPYLPLSPRYGNTFRPISPTSVSSIGSFPFPFPALDANHNNNNNNNFTPTSSGRELGNNSNGHNNANTPTSPSSSSKIPEIPDFLNFVNPT